MRLAWTRRALDDLTELHAWIAGHDAAAARRMADAVLDAAELLVLFPQAGRGVGVADARVLVVPGSPYLLDYAIRDDEILILAVTHGARRR